MTRQKSFLLAGNWKMNQGRVATEQFLRALSVESKEGAILRIYPPYLSLETAIAAVAARNLPLQVGAQNVHFETAGAFTGEISGPMLAEIGVRQVLIGHSERRQFFGESDEGVLKRTESALNQGFEVLVCVGETRAERESGLTASVLNRQMRLLLASPNCKTAFGTSLHLAYEPVWAIGTGVVATLEQAQEAHALLRALLTDTLGPHQADSTRILYGGSVSPSNFKALLSCPDIDGGLVGGASLKPESFQALWDLIPSEKEISESH